MESVIVRDRTREYGPRFFTEAGEKYRIKATVRYDDQCGNGHNSFSITGEIDRKAGNGLWADDRGGCIHDEIRKHFPKLEPFIKWHLCDSDSPVYYLENTIYHAKEISQKQDEWWFYLEDKLIGIVGIEKRDAMRRKYGKNADFRDYPNPLAKDADLDAARHTAIWPDATDEELTAPGLRARLMRRLPALMSDFREAVESMGFTY